MGINVEKAVIRLYEDPSLRDEISDIPAKTLLKWAENKLLTLAERNDDEEAFEIEYKALRQLIKTMNRFTGRKDSMDAQEKQEQMTKLVERAGKFGLSVESERVSAFMGAQRILPQDASIRALIELIDPTPSDPALAAKEDAFSDTEEQADPLEGSSLSDTQDDMT